MGWGKYSSYQIQKSYTDWWQQQIMNQQQQKHNNLRKNEQQSGWDGVNSRPTIYKSLIPSVTYSNNKQEEKNYLRRDNTRAHLVGVGCVDLSAYQIIKVKKDSKDRNRSNQVPHLSEVTKLGK